MGADLYQRALMQEDSAAGYYNKNVRVETPSGPVNVRIPIAGAESMDLRIWPESEVLSAIAAYIDHVPGLIEVSDMPCFQVHEFIEGTVLNAVAPRGRPLPMHVPADVVRLFAQLVNVPKNKLPKLPERWPLNNDTIGFARTISHLTARIHARFRQEYATYFNALGIPKDPLAPALDAWSSLRTRPLVCVHADVHRKNMIIKDGTSVFLDWELALWGDPVYDLAVHLHKMAYLPAEQDRVLELWRDALAPEHTDGWENDLRAYLRHEQIKSAIVDTVRYSQAFLDPTLSVDPRPELVYKLNNAYRHWNDRTNIEEAEVEEVLLHWTTKDWTGPR